MFPEAANICHKVFGVEHHLTKTTERFAAEYSASKTNNLPQFVCLLVQIVALVF